MQMEDAKLGKQIAALPCLLLPRHNSGLKRSCQDVDRGGNDVTVVIADVNLRHLFHVYIVSFLHSLI